MRSKSFDELFQEAESTEEYWIERAKLEATEAVVARMESQGLNRSQLAERLGSSPAYVTKLLRGDANLTLATLVKLATALESRVSLRFEPDSDVGDQMDDGEAVRAA